jgi:hypothetical protein
MCLSVKVADPSCVLSEGKHEGFEFNTVHNGMGYRCGYVKVEEGHPWHGKGYDDVDAEAHGGLTFARGDVPCDADGPDTGWWLGFDCGHSGDAQDPDLPSEHSMGRYSMGRYGLDGVVRDQEYVEAQCRSLCEQAKAAKESSDE